VKIARVWRYVVIFALLEVIIFLALSYEKRDKLDRHYKQNFEYLSSSYGSIFLNYQKIFEVLFCSVVDSNETALILLNTLKNSGEADAQRAKLLAKMSPVYLDIQKLGVKQFQFHLPDNASFLRVHEPSLYGDTLSGFRRTVYLVNRDKKPAFAFEVGRFASGFRYVFPIIRGENHLGSVEFGVGYESIMKAMQNVSGAGYALLVKKDALKKPNMSKKELDSFTVLSVCDDYLLEGAAKSEFTQLLEVTNSASGEFAQKLSSQKSFYFASKLKENFYTIGFYSIKDVGGAHIAYLAEYKRDGIHELYGADLIKSFAICSFFTLAFVLAIFFAYKKTSITSP